MAMFFTIAGYELRRHFERTSSYVQFFLATMFTIVTIGGVAVQERWTLTLGQLRTKFNSPEVLHLALAFGSPLALLLCAPAFGRAVQRDYDTRMAAVLFTTGMNRHAYLLGRFAAAFARATLLSTSVGLGMWTLSVSQLIEAGFFGENRLSHYLWPYLTTALPNLLFCGALCFAVGTTFGSMRAVYIAVVGLFAFEKLAAMLEVELGLSYASALLEPFGARAVYGVTRDWVAGEGNTQLVPLEGVLLDNRLLWFGVSVGLLAFTCARFRFERWEGGGEAPRAPRPRLRLWPWRKPAPNEASPREPAPRLDYSPWPILARETWLTFVDAARRPSFILLLFGMSFVFFVFAFTGRHTNSEVPTLPFTGSLTELARTTLWWTFLPASSFYAGELTFRERDARSHELLDALPVPDFVRFASKLSSLWLLQTLATAAILLTSIAAQAAHGYYRFELGLYLRELVTIGLFDLFLLAVAALAVQAIVQRRFLAHGIYAILMWLLPTVSRGAGFEHNLYRYGGSPGYTYSDMNGYGHFLGPVRWFEAYWAAGAVLLALVAHLAWQRGQDSSYGARWQRASARAARPAFRTLARISLVAAAGIGGFIYYNTNVLNAYETKDDRLRWRARYERDMAPRGQRLQPTIAHVDVDIDLFPEEQRLVASGTYTLVNDADSAIPVIIVTLLPGTRARDLRVSTASTPGYTHAQFGWYELELAEPLAPGAQIELAFEVERGSDGFVNGEPQHALTHNGSFVHNRVLPAIGYRANLEIEDPEDRMHFNLPPRASRGEANGASPARNAFSPDAHWMTLRTTVSTSADQVALAPGDLEREWESGGRRYFEYVMERPFTHFYAVVSGRWRVLRDEHQGVALEIHYHPGHEHNLERMMRAMKDTLDYGTAAFGPFPHRLLRIAEVPRYHRLAQSFPTLIPFGEAFGFLAGGMARGARYVDYPYYVTAHEVAHQWWGNQLLPAAGPGAQMLSESLAEYTALMVMKKALGTAPVQRFLRHELEQYLDQRKDDASTEAPLAEVTGQRFVYYAKASLAMYALQHYIGENAVNDAARALLERYRYQGPPYATASEFVELVRQRAPDELRYIVRDLLETTTSFRNRAKRATYSRRDDGRYVLELEVEAQKHRLMTGVTGTAGNLPVDLADLIEIGVVDEQGAPVAIEKRWIRESPATFELVLDAPPARAGIDPLHVLIDADPDDNVIAATAAARETLQASP